MAGTEPGSTNLSGMLLLRHKSCILLGNLSGNASLSRILLTLSSRPFRERHLLELALNWLGGRAHSEKGPFRSDWQEQDTAWSSIPASS